MADTELFRGHGHLNCQAIYVPCSFPSTIQVCCVVFIFSRAFFALTQPLYSSLSSRIETQRDHRPSPSTRTREPMRIKNTPGCLDDSCLVLQFVPGHTHREEQVTLMKNWGRWHEACSLILRYIPGYKAALPVHHEAGSCLPLGERLWGTSRLTKSLRGSDKWWKGVFYVPVPSLNQHSHIQAP